MKILRNRCQCRLCGDIIESRERHEFVNCECGEIFTDGGTDYIRRGANDLNNIIDLSEVEGMTVKEFLAEVEKYRQRNPELRQGQSMWNVAVQRGFLPIVKFVGGSCDPFYSLDSETEIHDRFLNRMVEAGLLVK